jgi:hypothetical protein
MLPTVSGTCPTIATATSLTFAGSPVQVWAGSSTPATPGALVMFWYETLGSSPDVVAQFGQAQIDAVTAAGGVVASFVKTNGMGLRPAWAERRR